MNCPHCQSALSEGSRFCGACGRAAIGTTEAPPPAKDPAGDWAGREIAGRYRIKSKLGEGGMGAVFKAEQISLKRVVALKLLRPEMVASPTLLRRFNAEAEAVAKLNHPNTVGIYDFGQDSDGTLFIAMELIDGRSLRAALVAEAPLSLGRSLLIAAQVAASLSDAHAAGIVHRDLKPDNIMLQDRGRARDIVRVLDFGIAKLRDDSRQTTQQSMTQAGDVLGTPQYMSPEQIRGEEIDGRSDIYSLGAILYEMVTGRMVFEAASLVAILSKHLLDQPEAPSRRRPELQIPAEIDELVLSCLSKDARARPASMERLAERLLVLSQTHAPGGASSDLLLRQGSLGEIAARPLSSVSGVAPTGVASEPALGAAPTGSAPPASMAGAMPSSSGPPTGPPPGPPAGPPPGPAPTHGAPVAVPTPPPVSAAGVPTPPPYAAPPYGAAVAPPPYASPYAPPYPPSPYGYAPGMPAAPAYSPVPLAGYPPPVASPTSAGNRVLWIALIVIAVLSAGGAAVYFAVQDDSTSRSPSSGSDDPAEPEGSGDSPWGAASSGSASDSASGSASKSGSGGATTHSGALAAMSPPRLANVGGRLYTARGFFKLLVPPELSPNPQQHASPDGNASIWTFVGESGVAVMVIASPLDPEVNASDPASAIQEFGSAQGMEMVSWSWRDLGSQFALSGIYKVETGPVEMRAEAVLYVKPKGFLLVIFACPEEAFDDALDYRDVLFKQRVTW